MSDKIRTYLNELRNDFPLIRAVFGVSLALILGTTMAYPSPHLTAILALMFLGPGKKPLGIKKEFIIVFLIWLLGTIGVIMGKQLIDYPFIITALIALAIFWSFRLIKIPAPIRLLFLLLVVLLPFNSITANAIGGIVLDVLLFNLIVALIIVKLSFILFPDKQVAHNMAKKKKVTEKLLDPDKIAINGVFVLLPIVTLFYLFNATVGVLTLVFVVILAFDPFIYQSKKGPLMIIANILGGVFGIVAYQLLVMVPNYLFYIFLILSIAFFFMINLFSEKKIAPVFSTSFNTFLVIMGIVSTSTSEAGSELWARLIQIAVAILYTVLAYIVVTAFNNPKISTVEA